MSILLSGGSDGRLWLDLISRQSDNERVVKVDVLEQNLMLYARQLLFILIIKEDALTTEEKARFILELTGNIMVSHHHIYLVLKIWSQSQLTLCFICRRCFKK